MGRHFIAMAGSHGCLPNHCTAHTTKGQAYADLAQLCDLSPA